MNLTFRLLHLGSPDLEATRHLFETAFPEEERPPFEVTVGFERGLFYEVLDDGCHIGLVVLVPYEDILYVFFLAVEPEYRGQGYGSAILDKVISLYSEKRIFLLAEEPGSQYADNEMRLKRLSFYAKNGFELTPIRITEYEVTYALLTHGKDVSAQEFLATMEYLLGPEVYRDYYENHISL